mmetsp:Transcript_21085/g.35958  ORF Transcript_21085/g.35958 Transcript_21085/m.35958 type:complete len:103 (+) Transcript_21085:601-909(+)
MDRNRHGWTRRWSGGDRWREHCLGSNIGKEWTNRRLLSQWQETSLVKPQIMEIRIFRHLRSNTSCQKEVRKSGHPDDAPETLLEGLNHGCMKEGLNHGCMEG